MNRQLNRLLLVSGFVLLLAAPLAASAGDDAAKAPEGAAANSELMDHSPADTKSMARMKKQSEAPAKSEKPETYVTGPDGKQMDHSPADAKAMRGMSKTAKPAKEAPATYATTPDGKLMDHSPADAKSMARMKKGEKKGDAKPQDKP